jgi:hypothetical protein
MLLASHSRSLLFGFCAAAPRNLAISVATRDTGNYQVTPL